MKITHIYEEERAIRCPFCGGFNIYPFVCEWKATSHDDLENAATLNEHQCIDCEGKSFWS